MASLKFTLEEVKNICKNYGYELLEDEYINARTKMKIIDTEGYMYKATLDQMKRNNHLSKFHKSNPYVMENIKLYIKLNSNNYELLSDEYVDKNNKLLFKCNKGHNFTISWDKFHDGHRCPICANKKVLKGYNDIGSIRPDLVKYFKNEEDAYKYTCKSEKYTYFICPVCNKEYYKMIKNIYRSGLNCTCECRRTSSYAERLMVAILDELHINYIKEFQPSWSNNKRYDFYLQEYNVILEMHGEQHYNGSFEHIGGKSLQQEQRNDKYKKDLALSNGIKECDYIIINCKKSELGWIKNDIIKSRLNILFDLSIIDWKKCGEFAVKNTLCKDICDYWNNKAENETVTDLQEVFKLKKWAITGHLKKGASLGWCNYNPQEEKRKNYKRSRKQTRKIEMFKDGKCLGIFNSTKELSEQSEELIGENLTKCGIYKCCRGDRSTYKGFTFRYVDK